MKIYINNKPISNWNLTSLKGTLNALTTPAKAKAVVYNDNASIDGSRAVNVPRRVQKRNVNIPVLMQCNSLRELEYMKECLIKELTSADEVMLSVTELGCSFYLKFIDLDNYKNFDNEGKATLSLNFVELNPTRRPKI